MSLQDTPDRAGEAMRLPAGLPDTAVFTVNETAKILRMSRTSIYDAINSGAIRAVRVGRTVRIPRAVLMELLEGQAANAA